MSGPSNGSDAKPAQVTAIRLAERQGRLLLGCEDGRSVAVRIPQGAMEFQAKADAMRIRALDAWEDAKLLLAADQGGKVTVWNIDSAQVAEQFQGEHAIIQAAILAPEEYVTVDAFRKGSVWRRTGGDMQGAAIQDGNSEPCLIDSFAVVSGGSDLALHEGFGWALWDRLSRRVRVKHEPVDPRGLLYEDGRMGLSGSGRFYYIYWDDYQVFETTTAAEIASGRVRYQAMSAALSDDGARLAIGLKDGRVLALGGDGKPAIECRPSQTKIYDVAVASGKLIAWRDKDGGAGLIDGATGAEILTRAAIDALLGRA